MQYITEEEAKQRAEQCGGNCRLAPGERLTPAAAEFLRANNYTAVEGEPHPITFEPASSIPVPGTPVPAEPAKAPEAAPATACCCKPCAGRTYLDANTQVQKSHPRIELRGRLDTLIAATVVVQTQFDLKNRLPVLLKTGLNDVKNWIWQMLASEISGDAMPAVTVCGMNCDMLHAVALDPQKYLGQGHIVPDASLGANVAFLNWLRAQVREVEVTLAKMGDREDLMESCNRLSTAVYVLMCLTALAEQGKDITKVTSK